MMIEFFRFDLADSVCGCFANTADPKDKKAAVAAPAASPALETVDVSAFAALVFDPVLGRRVAPRPLLSLQLPALRRQGVPAAQRLVADTLLPANANAGAESFAGAQILSRVLTSHSFAVHLECSFDCLS